MKHSEIVYSWNKQSDKNNQWDDLSEDEKCEWAVFFHFSIVAKWLAAVSPEIHEMYLKEFDDLKR